MLRCRTGSAPESLSLQAKVETGLGRPVASRGLVEDFTTAARQGRVDDGFPRTFLAGRLRFLETRALTTSLRRGTDTPRGLLYCSLPAYGTWMP